MSRNKTSDAIFVKNLEASTTVSAAQTPASTTIVDLTAAVPNAKPMVEQDVSAIVGTPSLVDKIDGSNDNVNWDVAVLTLPAATAVGRQVLDITPYKYYRRGIGTFASTTSITRSLKIIGVASIRPVTQP